MSSTIKVFLFLVVTVCISSGENTKEQCLCQRVSNRLVSRHDIKDIQIYQATHYCSRVEIIVTNISGLRYCLNPKLKAMQKLLTSIMKMKTNTTATPTEVTSAPLTVG